MTKNRLIARTSIALACALALSACGSDAESEGSTSASEPVAEVAPPAGQAWMDIAVRTPEGGTLIGNPDAPIKLMEYASHSCGHCATYAAESSGKIDAYVASGRVSFELRNQVHDALDLTIAVLARCAEPAAFYPLAHEGWANLGTFVESVQANPAAMQSTGDDRFVQIANAAGLLDFFAARGLPRDKATQCLSDTAAAEAIVNASNTQSEELGVTGTPTFFINGTKIDASNWATVEAALQTAGAR